VINWPSMRACELIDDAQTARAFDAFLLVQLDAIANVLGVLRLSLSPCKQNVHDDFVCHLRACGFVLLARSPIVLRNLSLQK